MSLDLFIFSMDSSHDGRKMILGMRPLQPYITHTHHAYEFVLPPPQTVQDTLVRRAFVLGRSTRRLWMPAARAAKVLGCRDQLARRAVWHQPPISLERVTVCLKLNMNVQVY